MGLVGWIHCSWATETLARANQKTNKQTYIKKREFRRNGTPMAKTEENDQTNLKNREEKLQNEQRSLIP